MKRETGSLVGPLAGWELVRLARRGQATRARLMTLYLLSVTFVGFVLLWFANHPDPVAVFLGTAGARLSPKEAAGFGAGFALAMMLAQLAAVVVITPGYAAAAVAEEKDRQTLPLLLATALTDREIVWGKAAGRVGFVVAGVAAGLPVMAATPLFGGADFASIGFGYAVVVGTAAACGAIGVGAACRAADLRSALIQAYVFTAMGCAFASPFWVLPLAWGEFLNSRAGWFAYLYPAAEVAFAAVVLAGASRNLRREVGRPGSDPPHPVPVPVVSSPGWGPEPARPGDDATTDWGPAPPAAIPVAPPRPARRFEERPWVPELPDVDDDDPLLWKERYVSYRPAPAPENGPPPGPVFGHLAGAAGALFAAAGLLLLATRNWSRPLGQAPPDVAGMTVVNGGVLMLGAYLFPLAIGVTGAIARERQRGTLDALLALPADREEIVWAKARAAAERGWLWGGLGWLAVAAGFAADGGAALALAGAALVLGGFLLVTGLGLWLSLTAPGDLKAFRMILPAVVLTAGLPVGIWHGMDWAKPRQTTVSVAAAGAVAAVCGLVTYRRVVRDLESGRTGRDTEHA